MRRRGKLHRSNWMAAAACAVLTFVSVAIPVMTSVVAEEGPAAFRPSADVHVRGRIDVEAFEVPAGVTVWIEGDLDVHCRGDLLVAGALVALPRASAARTKRGVGLVLQSDRRITIRGSLRAGDGLPGDGVFAAGGRGGSIVLDAPLTRVTQDIVAGKGGDGSPGGRGGDGGSIIVHGRVLSADAGAGPAMRAGQGGRGGVGLPGQDGGAGGRGGDAVVQPLGGVNGSPGTPGPPGGDGGPGGPGSDVFTPSEPDQPDAAACAVGLGGNSSSMADAGDGGEGGRGGNGIPPNGSGGAGGRGGDGGIAAAGDAGNGGRGGDCCNPPGRGGDGGAGGSGGSARGGRGGSGGPAGDGVGTGAGGNGGDGGNSGNAVGGSSGGGGRGGDGEPPGRGFGSIQGGQGIVSLAGVGQPGGSGMPNGQAGADGTQGTAVSGNDGAAGIMGDPCPVEDSLRVIDADKTALVWDPAPEQFNYDAIRGDVGSLGQSSDAQVDLGTVVCIENNSPDTTTAPGNVDTAVPPAGACFFYLIRFYGSYGRSSASADRSPSSGDCDPSD